jgi:hypothetical protein
MELFRALGALVEAPGPEQARLADAAGLPAPADATAHAEVFRMQFPPYASIYLGAEGMLGGEARDRVAGFWRAVGTAPPPEPDHLTTLLAAYASLAEHDGAAGDQSPWRPARHAFFWEHLASWLPPYLARVADIGSPFHRAWSRVLTDALAGEARSLGPPVSLPRALASTSGVADRGGAGPMEDLVAGHGSAPEGDLLDALLAPARSGLLLCRADLADTARALGLGLRHGERRFILRWLAGQGPAEVLEWLAATAARQAAAWGSGDPALRPVMDHWATRAGETARVLTDSTRMTPLSPQEAGHA